MRLIGARKTVVYGKIHITLVALGRNVPHDDFTDDSRAFAVYYGKGLADYGCPDLVMVRGKAITLQQIAVLCCGASLPTPTTITIVDGKVVQTD